MLSISSFTISSKKLSDSFNGFKLVHLSDLHNKEFGKNNQLLLEKIESLEPDIIAFTGDLVDQKKYNEQSAVSFMEQLTTIAPTYFVTGNHEWWSGKYDSLEKKLQEAGVYVLRNESTVVKRGEDTINLMGIDDPANEEYIIEADWIEGKIQAALNEVESGAEFNLLLSHRPELFTVYEKFDINLVLSGHAHGGQFRIPFIGGLIAPDQGFFPNYSAGKYEEEETTMIVSRGLGNSIVPQRIFNRPEIVEIILQAENE